MALTATATCDVVAELKELLGKPVCEIASANKPNSPTQLFRFSPKVPLKDNVHGVCSHVPLWFLFYTAAKVDKYTNLASLLLGDGKAIIYIDFVKDVAPLAISLRQQGLESCGYHGEKMSTHDKQVTLENWQKGQIRVMVCTSAFGMGIDQPDVDIVIRVNVPPSLEQLHQQFGRAGRDGHLCKGAVLYHESDLQHAAFQCKETSERQLQILQDFQSCWR